MSELFSMSYLGNDDSSMEKAYFDPSASLLADLNKERKKLSRLYDLVDDDSQDDDILKDKILKTRSKISEIQALLKDADKQAEITRKVIKVKNIFKNLKTSWPYFSPEEKQGICRDLIDRIEIHKGGEVKVFLKLSQYLIKNNI